MSKGNEVQPFTYPETGQQIRSALIDDDPWFVASDACAILQHTNTSVALRMLDEDDKKTFSRSSWSEALSGAYPIDDLRVHSVALVSEMGLYELILRSHAIGAKAFKRWVTHEVLPAIRKTGSYSVKEVGRRELAMMVIEAEDRADREADRAERAESKLAELEPDAARAQRTMDAKGLALVGTVAKRFGIKERTLFAFLRDEKLLIGGGEKRNEPYAKYIASGHFDVKIQLVPANPDRPLQERSTPMVTPKGEALIWSRLFKAGLVSSPTMPPRPAEQLALTAAS